MAMVEGFLCLFILEFFYNNTVVREIV